MEFKVGDRLLCKKDISFFSKGKEYPLTDIYNGYVCLISIDENAIIKSLYFSPDNMYSALYLYKYFYTKMENRKLKIRKLYNEYRR